MSVLTKAYMHDEAEAFKHVESMIWPEGAVCPHGGAVDSAYQLTGVRTKPSKKKPEGRERFGLWKCYKYRQPFTFKHGTKGVHQRCNKKHPHRDAAEFEFRYNSRMDDAKKAEITLKAASHSHIMSLINKLYDK